MNLKRYSGLALGVGFAGFLLMAQSSCSVIVNDFKHQCDTTDDCVALAAKQPVGPGGEKVSGLVCQEHTCVVKGCRSNKECQDAHADDPGGDNAYICRQSDRTCQRLRLPSADDPTTNTCDILADADDIANENTIWIGASVIYAPGSNQGLELVRQDFNKLAQGLPPATSTSKERRKLAFVYCEADPTLEEGAKHLINDLELPVVITSLDTTSEITVLQNETLPHDPPPFQLSTSAGGALLKGVDNKGQLLDLVLINENYHLETTELVEKYYTPKLLADGTLKAGEQPRVAIIHSGTATYKSLADKTAPVMEGVVGENNVKKFTYETSDSPTGDPGAYLDVVNGVLAFKPHVIVVMADEEIGPAFDDMTKMMTSEGVDVPIEQGWDAKVPGQPHPQWLSILGSVGQLPKDMGTLEEAAQVDWASRTLFIQQHYDFEGTFFQTYLEQLKALVKDDPNGVLDVELTSPFNEFLREGAYLTAYSYALLAAQGLPVTGPNLAAAARSFGKVSADTPSFPIGRDGIFKALQSIEKTKKPFDLQNFQGWNGFDENGFAKYDFADDVACVTPSMDDMGNFTLGALKPTGGIFETKDGALDGEILLTGCVGSK